MRYLVLLSLSFVSVCGPRLGFAEPFPARDLQGVDGQTSRLVNRTIMLAHMAGTYHDAGMQRRGVDALKEAEKLAAEVGNVRVRDWVLGKIANKYSGIGEHRKGLTLADGIQYAPNLVHTRGKIAGRLKEINEENLAHEILAEDLDRTNALESSVEKALCQAMLAGYLGKMGKAEKASKLIDDAYGLAMSLSPDAARVDLLTEIAGKMYGIAGKGRAIKVLRENIRLVGEAEPHANGVHHLVEIASVLSETDRLELISDVLLRMATLSALACPDETGVGLVREHSWRVAAPSRSRINFEIAHVLFKLDNYETGQFFAGLVDGPFYGQLVELDALKYGEGQVGKGRFKKMIRAVDALDNPTDKAELLIRIAKLAMRAGHAEMAVDLLARVDELARI